ncbi:MAG: glycoside hydrolase family 3 protein [Longimicrobiales bacterium]|nr:glycoside hydrolase family 3 protein [Longimicrobiales bacterium]
MKLDAISESVNAASFFSAAFVHPSFRSLPTPVSLLAAIVLAGCSGASGGEPGPHPEGTPVDPEVRDVSVADGAVDAVGDVRTEPVPLAGPWELGEGSRGGPVGIEVPEVPYRLTDGTELATSGAPNSGSSPGSGSGAVLSPGSATGSTSSSAGLTSAAPGASGNTGSEASSPDALAADPPWSERSLSSMTLWEKVGQMLMPLVLGDFAPEGSERHDEIVRAIEENRIGGVIVSVGSPTNVAVKLNDLQSHSAIPLLVASDLENGAGFRFDGVVHLPGVVELGGATQFPPLMAIGATGQPRYAYEVGRVTAREARALGIHVPFAPVLDVNNNPENPVINVRAFGEDPDLVAEMGVSFVQGVQDHGALATGKHFPGHGDTSIDSHVDLPVIPVSRDRLESVELLPFRRAVAAGMGGIMTAHLSVPELTGSGRLPATLSRPVITDLLRSDLGFDGLVFTDAMNMDAVERDFPDGEAAVRAVEAGADVILMPPDLEAAQEAIVSAIWSGRIDEERIDASVRRILGLKEQMGLHRRAEVSLGSLPRTVGVPEHTELAREIAERSITVLRNDRNLLPLLGTRSAEVHSVTYRGSSDLLAGRHFDSRLRETYPRLRTMRIDRGTPDEDYERIERRTRSSDLVVVSLYVSSVSRDGDPVLPDELIDYLETLEARRTPHIVVSFGNPYLITDIPGVQAYMLAWGGSRASQVAAAGALFGEFPIRGRLPIDIPRFFALGEGLRFGEGEVAERTGDR